MTRLPLLGGWRLVCEDAPDGSAPAAQGPRKGLSLPGEDALEGFADLLGGEDGRAPDAPEAATPRGVPLSLPAGLPPEAAGGATLTRLVDFGALHGDRAELAFSLLLGRGEALVDGEAVASFQDGPLSLDVTGALRRARVAPVSLRFDAFEAGRAAGVFGAATLRVSRRARLEDVRILPDAASRTMRVCARVAALRDGEYALRASFLPPDACPASAQESALALEAGETRAAALLLDAPAPRFQPGEPYRAPCVRVTLSLRGRAGAPCDEALLSCGYPGPVPRTFLPLSQEDLRQPPDALVRALQALHIGCVGAPPSASEALLRALTRAGIAARLRPESPEERERLSRFACAVWADGDAARTEESRAPQTDLLAVRALCSMIAYPRPDDPGLSPDRLLAEAAGREVDPDAPRTREVLAWLRAVSVRLRAEAARQGAPGPCVPLCRSGEWRRPDIALALQTALAPRHLSALPLYGAWWTRSHFSAALHAFIPDEEGGLTATASLESEEGDVLSAVRFDCPPGGGALGLIEAALPDAPCVLTLNARLLRGEEVVEQSAFPVYVGERGPLECAFSPR